MSLIKHPNLEVVSNGFVIRYDLHGQKGCGTYDDTTYLGSKKEVFVVTDAQKAFDRLMELATSAGELEPQAQTTTAPTIKLNAGGE